MTRRGTILFVVVVVLAIAALITAGMIQGASAARGSGRVGADRDQLRALAWSGVLGVMNELGAQRDNLLKGQSPTLTDRWQLYASGGLKGTVTLQPFGSARAVSECARLDVNGASAADLARLPALAQVAKSITSDQTWTSPEELRDAATSNRDKPQGLAPDADAGLSSPEAKPAGDWLKLVTVFSADAETAANGQDRVELGGDWDLASAKAAGGDNQGVTTIIQALAGDPKKPTTKAGLLRWLSATNAPAATWGGVLDAFCDASGVRTRVLDINRADGATLAGLPGLDAGLAEKLVAARNRLDPGGLASITWPIAAGVLTVDQLATLLPKITTRTLVWRVRVIAEITPATDDGAPAAAPAPGPGEVTSTGPGASPSATPTQAPGLRMILDAVIDVTGATPRVAYLRDGTWDGVMLPRAEPEAKSAEIPDVFAATGTPGEPAAAKDALFDIAPPELPGRRLGLEGTPPAAPAADHAAGPVGPRVGRWIGGPTRGGS